MCIYEVSVFAAHLCYSITELTVTRSIFVCFNPLYIVFFSSALLSSIAWQL